MCVPSRSSAKCFKIKERNYIDTTEMKKICLLEDYDHDHIDMLLPDIDEVMDEDDLQDIQSDHVQQRNTLENDR